MGPSFHAAVCREAPLKTFFPGPLLRWELGRPCPGLSLSVWKMCVQFLVTHQPRPRTRV